MTLSLYGCSQYTGVCLTCSLNYVWETVSISLAFPIYFMHNTMETGVFVSHFLLEWTIVGIMQRLRAVKEHLGYGIEHLNSAVLKIRVTFCESQV